MRIQDLVSLIVVLSAIGNMAFVSGQFFAWEKDGVISLFPESTQVPVPYNEEDRARIDQLIQQSAT